MGIFGKKQICCVCHTENGKYESRDGLVCQKCFADCGRFVPVTGLAFLKTYHKEEIKSFIDQNACAIKREKLFNPTLEIDSFAAFDDMNRLWRVNENCPGKMKVNPIVWAFSDFDDLEIVEDENEVIEGGLGSALVGGALFGDVGAIVGGVVGKKTIKKEIKKLEIVIKIKNASIPEVKITLIQAPVKSDHIVCKKMYDIAGRIVKKFVEIKEMNEAQKV